MSAFTLGFLVVSNLVLSLLLFWLLLLSKHRQQQYEKQINSQFSLIKKAYDKIKQAQAQHELQLQQLNEQSHTPPAPSLGQLASNKQIARLVRLGATVEDLVNEHQVPRGEAELLVSLREQTTHSL